MMVHCVDADHSDDFVMFRAIDAVGPIAHPRVLVVDDYPAGADALKLLLEQDGFEVRSACDACSARTIAHQLLPFAALVDLAMPGMSGSPSECHPSRHPAIKEAFVAFPRLTISVAVASLVVALVSAGVRDFALKYTIDSQSYPDVKQLAGTASLCIQACTAVHDAITVMDGPVLRLTNDNPTNNKSKAVYDQGTGVIEILGSVSAKHDAAYWRLQGQVTHDGNLITWRERGTAKNNKTASWRP